MQFVDVTTDIAFKKVFGTEQHKEILIGFLNAVLDLQGDKRIKEITLKTPWQMPDLSMLKETLLDIKAVDHRGIIFMVELQIKDQPFFDKRAIYHTANAYTTQFSAGEDYPIIFIGILDFNSFEGDHYLTRHLIMNKETLQQELCDFEFNFIELRKFNKQEHELQSIVEKWIYFIKNSRNLTMIPESAAAIPELKAAYTQAALNTWSKEELEIYEYWQLRDAAEQYGREGEFEKGKIEGKIDVARNLKSAGITLELIMQTTGLSREKIEGLMP